MPAPALLRPGRVSGPDRRHPGHDAGYPLPSLSRVDQFSHALEGPGRHQVAQSKAAGKTYPDRLGTSLRASGER